MLLVLPTLPPGLMDGSKALVLVVDDSGKPHVWTECRTDNNKTSLDPACKPRAARPRETWHRPSA